MDIRLKVASVGILLVLASGCAAGSLSTREKGAGIGAGIGALTGIAAIMLTRGPDAQIPRGSTMDLLLEHEVALDAKQIHFSDLGQPVPVAPLPNRP